MHLKTFFCKNHNLRSNQTSNDLAKITISLYLMDSLSFIINLTKKILRYSKLLTLWSHQITILIDMTYYNCRVADLTIKTYGIMPAVTPAARMIRTRVVTPQPNIILHTVLIWCHQSFIHIFKSFSIIRVDLSVRNS